MGPQRTVFSGDQKAARVLVQAARSDAALSTAHPPRTNPNVSAHVQAVLLTSVILSFCLFVSFCLFLLSSQSVTLCISLSLSLSLF
jgi:hypothetical protein